MIQLTSNLDTVIARVTGLKEVRIPQAMASALKPVVWKEAAMAAARRTLTALAKGDQHQYIEHFVREIYVTLMEGGLVMGLRAPDSRLSLAAAQLTLPTEQNRVAELTVPEGAMLELEQKLVDWVENEKRWDVARDGEKTPENVYAKASWIMRLLLSPPGALSRTAFGVGHTHPGAPPAMSEFEARESLMPAVLDYIATINKDRSQQVSLDRDTAGIWLRAVLAAWSALVRGSYRNEVVLQLRKT